MFQFGRYRVYFTQSPEKHYALSGDIKNSVFDKYTVNDTKFILLAEPYWFDVDWKHKDIAGGKFSLHIYTKPEISATYRLLKATIKTSSFSMDVYDMEEAEAVFYSSETTNRSDGYKQRGIRSNYYRFPCPKDMKYSITVFIEEEKDDGIKTIYEFSYYYFLKKKDNWFRLLI